MVQTRQISDGFDLYPSNVAQLGYGIDAYWQGATGSISMIPGRFTGQGIRVVGNSVPRYRVFAEDAYGVTGFAFRLSSVAADGVLALIQSMAGASQIALGRTNANQLALYRGNAVSDPRLAITAGPVLIPSVWHYIELAWRCHDTLGTLAVYLDGEHLTDLDYTGDTKLSSDGALVGRVSLISFSGANHDYDDFYVETGGNTRVGEGRFEVLPPTGDISHTGFVPSFGDLLYPVLANVPAGTSYTADAETAGDIVRLAHRPLQTSPEAIYGVQLINLSSKNEAGTRKIANVVWSDGTPYTQPEQALMLDSFSFKDDWLAVDPDTAVAWIGAGVNAANIGVTITL